MYNIIQLVRIALGHVHKKNEENNNNFIYPGSMISFGFDELGEHGMLDVIIEENNKKNKINNYINKLEENNINNLENNYLINKNKIKIKFIKLDNRIFEENKQK